MGKETKRDDVVVSGPQGGGGESLAAPQAAPGKEEGGNPLGRFIRNSPFLVFSILLHLTVLGLLAFVTARTPPAPKRRIVLNVEEVEITEELRPLHKEVNLFEEASAARGFAGPGAETYESVREQMEEAKVRAIDVLGLEAAVREGSTEDFEGIGTGRGLSFAVSKTATDTAGAIDQFAVMTLNCIRSGPTLTILLIDQSRSIVYENLPIIIKRMDHYFKEIEMNVGGKMWENGQWVVVGFGRNYRFLCEPTSDLAQVKAALGKVRVDTSGIENTGQAISGTLTRYGKGYKHILIGVMTDEAGDDIYNPQVLEALIKQLREMKATLCVFGRESAFGCRKEFIRFKLDPELLREADLAAIRGFEGRTMEGFADTGPESPRPELWWTPSWHTWTQWGGNLSNLPSGFGMYGLNRMTLATGGIYFLLKVESDYDEERLYARYKPDICSVSAYLARVKKVPLKRELVNTWIQMGKLYGPYQITKRKQAVDAVESARKGRAFCIAKAKELQHLLDASRPVGENWLRWRAHAELTIAELLRLRFMLGEYHYALSKVIDKIPREMPEGKWIVVRKGKVPDDYAGLPEEKAEYDLAKRMIQRVIDNHPKTPWETAARRMLNGLNPWRCSLEDRPKGRPMPPSLAF